MGPEGVLNGTPSAQLAQAAQGVLSVRVVCQTEKFASAVKAAPGYDIVKLLHVDQIVTQEGALSPDDALARIR